VNAPADLPLRTAATDSPAEAVFARLAEQASAFDLFQAMRRIECAFPDKPRLGDAMRPLEEPFRFAQEPSLIFAPAPIAAFERSQESTPPRLVQRVFGFLGPNGALPTQLTEYARERQLYSGDRTFGRFLDMLLHRFGLFFYRAWARTQPVVALDRPDDAPIVRHIGALIGLIEPSSRNRDALGDFPKLFFAGRLARSVRDADGLEAWLTLQFGGPVRVDQFQGHWMPLGRQERSRLRRDGQPAVGRGAVLGKTVWDVQHKFRIVMGPLAWERFATMLPDGRPLAQLRALVRQYVGFEFAWDLRLILKREDVPVWNLSSGRDQRVGRLGRTAWLHGGKNYRRAADAGELIMNVESIRLEADRMASAAA
jgi:type VI secretion system protein ImpH